MGNNQQSLQSIGDDQQSVQSRVMGDNQQSVRLQCKSDKQQSTIPVCVGGVWGLCGCVWVWHNLYNL